MPGPLPVVDSDDDTSDERFKGNLLDRFVAEGMQQQFGVPQNIPPQSQGISPHSQGSSQQGSPSLLGGVQAALAAGGMKFGASSGPIPPVLAQHAMAQASAIATNPWSTGQAALDHFVGQYLNPDNQRELQTCTPLQRQALIQYMQKKSNENAFNSPSGLNNYFRSLLGNQRNRPQWDCFKTTFAGQQPQFAPQRAGGGYGSSPSGPYASFPQTPPAQVVGFRSPGDSQGILRSRPFMPAASNVTLTSESMATSTPTNVGSMTGVEKTPLPDEPAWMREGWAAKEDRIPTLRSLLRNTPLVLADFDKKQPHDQGAIADAIFHDCNNWAAPVDAVARMAMVIDRRVAQQSKTVQPQPSASPLLPVAHLPLKPPQVLSCTLVVLGSKSNIELVALVDIMKRWRGHKDAPCNVNVDSIHVGCSREGSSPYEVNFRGMCNGIVKVPVTPFNKVTSHPGEFWETALAPRFSLGEDDCHFVFIYVNGTLYESEKRSKTDPTIWSSPSDNTGANAPVDVQLMKRALVSESTQLVNNVKNMNLKRAGQGLKPVTLAFMLETNDNDETMKGPMDNLLGNGVIGYGSDWHTTNQIREYRTCLWLGDSRMPHPPCVTPHPTDPVPRLPNLEGDRVFLAGASPPGAHKRKHAPDMLTDTLQIDLRSLERGQPEPTREMFAYLYEMKLYDPKSQQQTFPSTNDWLVWLDLADILQNLLRLLPTDLQGCKGYSKPHGQDDDTLDQEDYEAWNKCGVTTDCTSCSALLRMMAYMPLLPQFERVVTSGILERVRLHNTPTGSRC